MKKSGILVAILYLILFTSCEQEISVPDEFVVSQGTYIGTVHIAHSSVSSDEVVNYAVERFNEDNAKWENINWSEVTVWDDSGWETKVFNGVPTKLQIL